MSYLENTFASVGGRERIEVYDMKGIGKKMIKTFDKLGYDFVIATVNTEMTQFTFIKRKQNKRKDSAPPTGYTVEERKVIFG